MIDRKQERAPAAQFTDYQDDGVWKVKVLEAGLFLVQKQLTKKAELDERLEGHDLLEEELL